MTMDYVKSDTAFKPYKKTIHDIVKKILNYKSPKSTAPPPPPPPGTPNPKKRNKGEQSYADLAGLFDALASTITPIPGYLPTNNDLKIAQMAALSTSFKNTNRTMADLDADASLKITKRFNLYEGDVGVKARMLGTKSGVRAQ